MGDHDSQALGSALTPLAPTPSCLAGQAPGHPSPHCGVQLALWVPMSASAPMLASSGCGIQPPWHLHPHSPPPFLLAGKAEFYWVFPISLPMTLGRVADSSPATGRNTSQWKHSLF